MPAARRTNYKVRASTSNFVAKEDQKKKDETRSMKELEVAPVVDPFFSFQTMESMLGAQRMELHRLIHAYHETAMKFLTRKEQTWRRTELECKDLQSELERVRQHGTDKSGVHIYTQLEQSRVLLTERDEACRRSEAECFELREQLAAMQALGASYQSVLSLTAGDPESVPGWSQGVQAPQGRPPSGAGGRQRPACPPFEPDNSNRSPALRSTEQSSSVRLSAASLSFLEKLDSAQPDPLARLERAQLMMGNWGARQRLDPVAAGMVDYNTMDFPPLPGSMDERAMDPTDPRTKALAIADAGQDNQGREKQTEKPDDDDEEDEEDMGGGAWNYFRAKKGKKDPSKKKALDMKDRAMDLFNNASYKTVDKYKSEGCAQSIVRGSRFENMTMALILVNTVWIGIDDSFNVADVLAEADAGFIIAENLFCIGFLSEIVIRFAAYRSSMASLQDKWFLFDLSLVLLMVFDTWIMFAVVAVSKTDTGSLFDTSVLRIFKLLRLTRVGRIARLLRLVPEVAILLKGIGVATRSVFWTVSLLSVVIYVFAIVMTQLSANTDLGNRYFPTLVDGMFSLLYYGCFRDGLAQFAHACFKEHIGYGLLVSLFLIIAPLTVMNMIVGVLVEVVGIVAAAEQESSIIQMLSEQLHAALLQIDANNDGQISKHVFFLMGEMPDIVAVFTDAGIDAMALVRDPDIICAGDEEIGFQEFLDEILTQRGSNPATVKDLVQLKKQLLREIKGVVGTGKRPLLPVGPR
eukprot:TRINITY_DN31330_c0_g1_i1.p1 TRINITY_DN31330_c0_g1~~TRINITY_DN31330_c0_g1_i1.p1  ORF type:complete len:749 (-),score=153.22 TRINITY_DN31330_c0_g1_i1:53-2299(-)